MVSPSLTISIPAQPQLQGTVNRDSAVSVIPVSIPNADDRSPEPISDVGDIDTETPSVCTDLPEAHGPLPAPAESVATSRHRRSARKPPIYKPESGKWVVNK